MDKIILVIASVVSCTGIIIGFVEFNTWFMYEATRHQQKIIKIIFYVIVVLNIGILVNHLKGI